MVNSEENVVKTLLMIAGAALTFATGLTASAADAQNQRRAPSYAQDGYGRESYDRDRDRRLNRRQDGQQIRYWRDGLGRRCYRRSDGVRRCEAVGPRREYQSRRNR